MVDIRRYSIGKCTYKMVCVYFVVIVWMYLNGLTFVVFVVIFGICAEMKQRD